jgi:hypothetical protein
VRGGQFATQPHSEPDLHLANVDEGVTHTDPTGRMATRIIPRPPESGQSLADRFPAIAAQWHPTRNDDLTPNQVSKGSGRKVWWRCEDGHVWEASVNNRTSMSSGCSVCAGKTVLTGYNDLTTRFPDISTQWHPTRNGDLTPDQVLAGTNAKVWWRCEDGHEWETTVNGRTSGGNGCPVCSGQKLLPGYNDLATRFPDISAQWHPTRNGDLTTDQVSAGMNAKVWWRCEDGHEWETTVNGRTSGGSGCPVHARQKVRIGFGDLASRFPDVAAQWHPNRNGDRTPDQVLAGTVAKAWWRCNLGHVWEARVNNRATHNTGCPVCAGRTVLAGYNDLGTRFPAVAAQWHPTRNGDLRPDQVLAGTVAKMWWRCEQGHEWEARVGSRTSGGRDCPVCSVR